GSSTRTPYNTTKTSAPNSAPVSGQRYFFAKAAMERMDRAPQRTKVVDIVVDQLSPCFSEAAQGRCSHSSGPFSSPGRLCQGSMQRKCIGLVGIDQISTRLNSSHVSISYAVFCL